ncbi:hypothetical protein [Variovorax paradoxus]|uniref:hypothetical protein n=1 Tax=Variovorax paradoxus TaxID=34073 RepID=UPI0029C938CC|nr:hypothetical protein [Variovorax paradoxus]WPH18205.1 hypothetical protein RZE78_14300 [Variovorax paradoxus]
MKSLTLHPVLRSFIAALPARPAARKPAKVWPAMAVNPVEVAMHNQFVDLLKQDRVRPFAFN